MGYIAYIETICYKSPMSTPTVRQKLIEVRPDVLEAVERDAARCGRTANKQIEAILITYYSLGDVNIRNLADVRKRVGVAPVGSKTASHRPRRKSA